MKLYVGNLPWKIDNNALKNLFTSYGDVEDAVVIIDKFSKRSKGFGFVTLTSEDAAKKAIVEMHEKEFEGRPLTVSEAKPMVQRNEDEEINYDRKQEKAPIADSNEINNILGDSFDDEIIGNEENSIKKSDDIEIIDDNSDAEGDEEDIETVDEAMEDSRNDEPAVKKAIKAKESTELEDDNEENEE